MVFPAENNNIDTKLYDKLNTLGFDIVKLPFMSRDIPSAPAYGVFLSRHRGLVTRILSQG